MKDFDFVLAVDKNNGLGKNGKLAWHIPADMKFFKNLTTNTQNKNKQNAVIMGKNTWLSIPDKYRPLPGRKNIVLSKTLTQLEGAEVYSSFEAAIESLSEDSMIEKVFVIGGAQIYNSLLYHPYLHNIYITKIQNDYNCDIYFHGIPSDFTKIETMQSFRYDDFSVSIDRYQKTN